MPRRSERKKLVKFAPKGELSFYDAVKQRVDAYFEEKKVSQHGNLRMYVKTVAMLSMYFVPYLLIATGVTSGSGWLFFGLWALMGLGVVGIGTSVMHDSNHGAYSKNKLLSTTLGGVLNVLGGYVHNWKIQHNILHHTYTNLEGLDEDLEGGKMLRMCPQKPLQGFHKYQHIYAWGIYCLMNLYWITAKDYLALFRYEKNGMLRNQKISLRRGLIELSLLKVFYVAYLLVLPIMFSGMSWWMVLAGFGLMHVVSGFGLACVFQPAHVMESSEFPTPCAAGKMENSWAVHQVLNTTNFCPDNKIVSWFIGGLNYQIEHHLFPHICHVHYPRISAIVRYTAEEYGLPYQVQPTFTKALIEHGKMLKKLGRTPMVVAPVVNPEVFKDQKTLPVA